MQRRRLVRGARILRSVMAGLAMLAGLSARARAQAPSAVHGVVRDSAGAPVEGVEIGLAGGAIRVRSDASGAYRLAGVVDGEATLTARRLGFAPFALALRLAPGRDRRADIVLAASAGLLEGVEVKAAPEIFESRLAGYNERLKRNAGHFVTRERIARANSTTLTDMLREVPGVHIGPSRNQGRAVRLRGANCPPLVFVDGFPASAAEFDLDLIDLASVEGIEVYSGLGSTPAEFTSPRNLERCGVIAVWSRPARPRQREMASSPALARGGAAPDATEIYTSDRVGTPAAMDPGTAPPVYPDSLLKLGMEGRVVAEFVVDRLGFVEVATIDVLQADDSLFAESVRESLAGAHFRAAMVRGERVRQLVQLPFVFALPKTAPPAGARPRETGM